MGRSQTTIRHPTPNESGDYAVRAAREWMDTNHPVSDYGSCSCISCKGERKAYKERLADLATIIRKHCDEYVSDYSCGCMHGKRE